MLGNMYVKPSVITLDINMPGMNGVEFLAEYTKRGYDPIVVAMITSSVNDKDISDCLAYDLVKGYRAKPVNKEFLNIPRKFI